MSEGQLQPIPERRPVLTREQQGALVELLVEGVQTGLAVWKLREGARARWETVHQEIALLDKQAEPQLKKLEQDLAVLHTKTERLQSLLDFFAVLDPHKSEWLAASVGRAIEQLTRD